MIRRRMAKKELPAREQFDVGYSRYDQRENHSAIAKIKVSLGLTERQMLPSYAKNIRFSFSRLTYRSIVSRSGLDGDRIGI
ncbi:hypothetical protein HPP92_000911 [Vanilla planifolia]|uniref:Uncharacterized protein n=1 Tax=Vanilla planifolia TaxID=51239 RepID=A0A835RYY7_VANPL|nr:hypothetical protein HPP92_000911 [Vanilla planifolia]